MGLVLLVLAAGSVASALQHGMPHGHISGLNDGFAGTVGFFLTR